ncbi:glycoside hydrolase family 3 N-terminal domain-containing protein [Dactylosporangium sp. AC04546]|uniref:glycoside hydrolase family 3 N-terminal domain-containing protein n=1 Tax=Dactylosporangium sp. AC04546 TaxID=2862460 RepID=UPI001EE10A90|nr:glycoside hydrolase family 3 N-terminal domain-containing protein [Dactylosporangium sp. AC04546]WVK86157.1 glycoside hydrolase family 3 N-terminal domain-containing protein [Dactylosporangium sp. AC04546]
MGWTAAAVAVVLVAGVGIAYAVTRGGESPPRHPAPPAATAELPGASPSPTADCAASIVQRMSLEERVGQLLMIGTPVGSPADAKGAVQRYHLGGIFLAGRSTASAATLKQAVDQLQAAAGAVRLHVAVDQEGGQVQTLKGPDFPAIPTAVNQGKLDQKTLAANTAEWAGRLEKIGVTLDLAPVADVVPPEIGTANPPIGKFQRQYGPAPGPVAEDVATVVAAVQGAGVLTTLKHFPGLGRVRVNTDTSTGARDDLTTAEDPALEPFRQGIAAGSAAVMMSSAAYPKLDPDAAVAAFSEKIVTGLLREQLGFQGMVLSDDLGAAKAVSGVPLAQRAVRFVRAGGDVALTVRLSDAGPMTDALLAAAKADPAFAERVARSATRVLATKVRAGLATCQ